MIQILDGAARQCDSCSSALRISISSCRKLAVEIPVVADPNPDPQVCFKPLCNGSVLARHAHRPKPGIRAQPLQLQRRVSGVITEFSVSRTGCLSNLDGQCVVSLPEVWRRSRLHECRSKSLSWISGKTSGFAFSCASMPSPSAVNAGRGRVS